MEESKNLGVAMIEKINLSSKEADELGREIFGNILAVIEHDSETLKINNAELNFLLDSFKVVNGLPFFACFLQSIKVGIKYFNMPETEKIDEIIKAITDTKTVYFRDIQEWLNRINQKNTDFEISKKLKEISTSLHELNGLIQDLIQ